MAISFSAKRKKSDALFEKADKIYWQIAAREEKSLEESLERANKKTSSRAKTEFSINQVALIFHYEGKAITRKNGNKIAKEYGHNSGEKLFQKFTFFSSSQNRKGKPNPPTPKKFKNKIDLFESVIEKLSNEAKSRAMDDINTLKTLFQNIDL